jgi:hypothetical protein
LLAFQFHKRVDLCVELLRYLVQERERNHLLPKQ